MARVKEGDRVALLREAEAVLANHGDKSNCAERVFLALHAIAETDISPEAVCLLTGLGGWRPERARPQAQIKSVGFVSWSRGQIGRCTLV